MWIRLIRMWIQLGIWTGKRKKSEDKFFVCYLFRCPAETEHDFINRIWKILWDEGWSVLLTGYSFYGQMMQMRKVEGNHQQHLRLIHKKEYEPCKYHIETHSESKWECHYEHSHEIDLRPLNQDEKDSLIVAIG